MVNENEPLLVNDDTKHKPSQKQTGNYSISVQQLALRMFVLVSFAVAKEVERVSLKQYIYRWIEDHNVDNETVSVQNDSTTDSCGANTSVGSEKENQKLASQWMWYFTVTEHGLALTAIVFYGIYSDFIGRKPMMIISEAGYIFRFGVIAFIIYKQLHLKYLFIAYSVSGMCGCQYTFYLGMEISIADKTARNQSRSIGFAVYESLVGIGISLSDLGTGYIIKFTGYFYPVVISGGLTLVNMTFLFCCLPETLEKSSNMSKERLTLATGIRRLFGFYYDKSKIINKQRWKFITAIGAYFIAYLLITAEGELCVLYQMRSPFCWKSDIIGRYGFIMYMLRYVIGIAILRMLQTCAMDEVIAVVGCVSGIISFVIEGIAQSSLMLYVAGGIGLLSGIPLPLLRSVCSRMVDADRQGALFANIGVMENLCVFCGTSIFNNIYGITQSFMPGFVFIIIGSAFVIPIILTTIVATSNHRLQEKYQTIK